MRKGCTWHDAQALAKGEKPPSLIAKEKEEAEKKTRKKEGKRKSGVPSSAVEAPERLEKEEKPKREPRRKTGNSQVFVAVPPIPDPPNDKGIKRKHPDDSTEAGPRPAHSFLPGESIRYRPRSRPRPQVATSPAPSPNYGFDVIDSLNTSPLFLGSSLPSPSLDPPPSFAGSSSFDPLPSFAGTTSSSSSLVSHSSLTLEVAILRSQLDAANDSLRRERELSQRERERSQQEVRTMEEQFDRERKAYQEYIKSLESRRQ